MRAAACDRYPPAWGPLLVGQYLTRAAATRPDTTAIVASERSCTYAELRALAASYADALLDAGIAHGDALLVAMEPGIELVATFVAATSIGAIHVPCNVSSPVARLADVAGQVRAKAIVAVEGAAVAGAAADATEALGGYPVVRAGRDGLSVPCALGIASRPPRSTIESDVAYVIFTSGSTGRPKGVVMAHRAAVAAFRGIEAACHVRGPLASCAPAGFDLSILDMAAALGRGETLVFVPHPVQLHPLRLVEHLTRHRVTQMHSVPSLWQLLVRFARHRLGELTELRRIVLGGEALTPRLVHDVRAQLPHLSILNLYGQTESICCSFGEVANPLAPDAVSIPVGEPYPGIDMVLIGEDGREVVEPGGAGELYLRAASLFSGYWEDAEQTAARIVADPTRRHAQDRWLKTGDVLRREADGLHFMGRVDRQVQLFGNRVELGEIEACLAHHDAVSAVVVVAVAAGEWESTRSLVAFVEHGGEASADGAALQEYCRARLAPYMVPARFMTVDAWPLAATGKVDVAALEDRARDALSMESV